MHSKPLSSIAAELNNVLTVIAMCTDEVEQLGTSQEAFADMRDALQRGAALTRALGNAAVAEESSPQISQVTEKAARTKTVLVIDEEPALRRAVARAVEARGLSVLEASSGQDALQNLEVVPVIDLIVLDSSFENRRSVGRLVERYPSASVLFTGSYADDELLRHELPRSDVSLVCRPFTTSILVDRIDQVLGRQR